MAAVACALVVAAGCGLDLGGLEDVAGGEDGGGPDVLVTADGTVGGHDGAQGDGPGDDATTGPDGADTGSAADALGEPAPPDAPTPPPVDAGCKGVVCDGNCTGASDCAGCGGANLLCQATNTCTSDCTACPGNPIQCFACDLNHLNPIGTCQPDVPTLYCLDTNYAGAYQGGPGTHCACTFATDCPSENQVCINIGAPPAIMGCFTCGETDTDMFTCKGGKNPSKCNAMKATCN